jgi:hypothetical protein
VLFEKVTADDFPVCADVNILGRVSGDYGFGGEHIRHAVEVSCEIVYQVESLVLAGSMERQTISSDAAGV